MTFDINEEEFFKGRTQTSNETRDTRSFNINLGDWLSGIKRETYYIGKATNDTGTEKEICFNETFSSTNNETEENATSTSFTKEIDLDFDYKIEGSRLIGGDFIGIIKFDMTNTSGNTTEAYIIMKIVRFDGTTETILGEGRTKTLSSSLLETISLTSTVTDVLNKESFKVGDILRIKMEGWIKSTSVDVNHDIKLFHGGSDTLAKIPFINLDEY